jgi:hypothetical protein
LQPPAQIAINQASYRLSTGRPVLENLLGLGAFALLAAGCLWRSLRRVQGTWAEALLAPKGTSIRWVHAWTWAGLKLMHGHACTRQVLHTLNRRLLTPPA